MERRQLQEKEGVSVMRKAFTLIELLIVIAIIAILALIAVPNFLEAQVRAKVARVKSDERTLATGLEAYSVDWGGYPPGREKITGDRVSSLWRLTTPVAYATTMDLIDPFVEHGATTHNYVKTYLYFCYASYAPWAQVVHGNNANFAAWGYHMGWCVSSPGPDRALDGAEWAAPNLNWNIAAAYNRVYDATNGTISRGDIMRFGGELGTATRLN
jgi:prepilin-type N-terminal cleavage/methylation domain-containing protein